jgi:hypothetical protein
MLLGLELRTLGSSNVSELKYATSAKVIFSYNVKQQHGDDAIIVFGFWLCGGR